VASRAARSCRLPAPVGAVWDVLARFDDIADWAPAVVDHSAAMGGGDGVGRARRIQAGRSTVVEVVEVWDPPARLAYRLEGLPRPIRRAVNEWRLEPDGAGTRATLTSEVEVGPRPPQRLVERIALRRLTAASDGLLDGLARRVEESEQEVRPA
jgi:hypothetical protein